MNAFNFTQRSWKHPRASAAYSLPEVIITVAVLGIIASIAIYNLGSVRVSVSETKLRRDVVNLNNSIKLYVANGGTLDGVENAQQVVDKLKTRQSAAAAQRYVGPHTGVSVDARLRARTQSADETASNSPRAVWSMVSQRFEISSTPGAEGVAEFLLDADPTQFLQAEEDRTPSNILYNGDAGAGWVWQPGNHAPAAPPTPLEFATSTPSGSPFNPTATPPPYSPPAPSLIQLPSPAINPAGGTFIYTTFPSKITIDPNGAAGGSVSKLMYQIVSADGTATAWQAYTSWFTVTPGQTVQAVNESQNTSLYATSSLSSALYEAEVLGLPAPSITPAGGTFPAGQFPSSITIASNGAPGGSASALRYMIRHASGDSTAWLNYNTAFSVLDGDEVTAANFSLDPLFFSDSPPVVETYKKDTKKLPPPILTETTQNGKRVVVMTMDPSVPVGSYITFTTNGLDPDVDSKNAPIRGNTYKNPLKVPSKPPFEVFARVYPPKALADTYIASELADLDLDFLSAASPGLAGGHIDVDTSSRIYPLGAGKTDGHVHAYDDKFFTTTVDLMHLQSNTLRAIQDVIPNGVRFKLIVSNAELSTGARVSINKDYDSANPTTYTLAKDYDNDAPAFLPTYSMDGVGGSTKLTSLAVSFDPNAIVNGGLIGTVTGAVRSNQAGAHGEYRNGALTIQAVLVNADGSAGFTTDTSLSSGGAQGVAKSGLLWEATMFWHWSGGAYGNGH